MKLAKQARLSLKGQWKGAILAQWIVAAAGLLLLLLEVGVLRLTGLGMEQVIHLDEISGNSRLLLRPSRSHTSIPKPCPTRKCRKPIMCYCPMRTLTKTNLQNNGGNEKGAGFLPLPALLLSLGTIQRSGTLAAIPMDSTKHVGIDLLFPGGTGTGLHTIAAGAGKW